MTAILEAVRAGVKWPEILDTISIPYRLVEQWKIENVTFAARLDRAMAESPEVRCHHRRLEHLIRVHKLELPEKMAAPLRRRDTARQRLADLARGWTRPREGQS